MAIEFGEYRHNEITIKHIGDVLGTNWISAGPKVAEFERQWGELFDYKHNVAMSSGTDAVINACLVLYENKAKPGDEVIVPALGFIATANAVRAAGFTPIFVDVKKETLNIDEDKIEEKITEKTQAIIAVHTMGKMCNMNKLKKLCGKHRLWLIEDACEAHAASYQGELVGTQSDMACFSFYAAHCVTCGEGGIISTDMKFIADILNSTKSHGRKSGLYFDHDKFGLNSKMNDLEASIGLGDIKDFWETFTIRRNNVDAIYDGLEKYKYLVWFSEEDDGDINCPHGFSITLKKPNKLHILTKALDEANICWKRNFGSIPTQHKAFKYLGHNLGDFPNAEYIGDNGIHIGVHKYLTDKDLQTIVDTLTKALEAIK